MVVGFFVLKAFETFVAGDVAREIEVYSGKDAVVCNAPNNYVGIYGDIASATMGYEVEPLGIITREG